MRCALYFCQTSAWYGAYTDGVSSPPDFAISREDLHGLLCAGDFPGLLLPGQPDLGRGCHGLRGAEPGHHRRGVAERERVSTGYGTPEERPEGTFHIGVILKLYIARHTVYSCDKWLYNIHENTILHYCSMYTVCSLYTDICAQQQCPCFDLVFLCRQHGETTRQNRWFPPRCPPFAWRRAVYAGAGRDPTERSPKKPQRRQKRSLTPWMSSWYGVISNRTF